MQELVKKLPKKKDFKSVKDAVSSIRPKSVKPDVKTTKEAMSKKRSKNVWEKIAPKLTK